MSSSAEKKPGKAESLANVLIRVVFRAILYMPWIWFAVFGLLVLVTTLQVGHLPSYGQPDPKDTVLGGILYVPAMVLFFLVLGSTPFGIALSVARIWQGVPQFIRRWEVFAYYAGLILFFFIIMSDALGLMTWLAD